MELYKKTTDGKILVFDLKGKKDDLKLYREKHLKKQPNSMFYMIDAWDKETAKLVVKDQIKTILENPKYNYKLVSYEPYTDESQAEYKEAIQMYTEGLLSNIKPAIQNSKNSQGEGFLMNRFLFERRAYYLKLAPKLLALQLVESSEWHRILNEKINIIEALSMFTLNYIKTLDLNNQKEGEISEEQINTILKTVEDTQEIIKMKVYSNNPPFYPRCDSFF